MRSAYRLASVLHLSKLRPSLLKHWASPNLARLCLQSAADLNQIRLCHEQWSQGSTERTPTRRSTRAVVRVQSICEGIVRRRGRAGWCCVIGFKQQVHKGGRFLAPMLCGFAFDNPDASSVLVDFISSPFVSWSNMCPPCNQVTLLLLERERNINPCGYTICTRRDVYRLQSSMTSAVAP